MDEHEIKSKLDELVNLRAACDALTLQKQELIDLVIPFDIKAKIADIEAEFVEKVATASEKSSNFEGEIKQAIISHGQSVKGAYLHAIFMKGRVSWDNKGLDGFMIAHPEIVAFRKEGEPSCSLRNI